MKNGKGRMSNDKCIITEGKKVKIIEVGIQIDTRTQTFGIILTVHTLYYIFQHRTRT